MTSAWLGLTAASASESWFVMASIVSCMPTLVLDPRWPDMVPAHLTKEFAGGVDYTPEVPEQARVWPYVPGAKWTLTTEDSDDAVRVPSLDDPVARAVAVMHTARGRGEWEQSMTHERLLPYLKEEAAELAQAIEEQAGDEELKKELADVLLQVLFHAELAAERGAFTFADVAHAFVTKMQSRAPYLFDGSEGTVDIATQDRFWAEGKVREAEALQEN